MSPLLYIVDLLNLGCLIYVLTKMYPKEGVLKTILGFICGLYAFIWGWMNIKNQDSTFKNVMYVWTGLVVLAVILAVVANIIQANLAAQLGG